MLDASVALKALGPEASTQALKEALEGKIPSAVVQKEYNVPKTQTWMDQNAEYVMWYVTKKST